MECQGWQGKNKATHYLYRKKTKQTESKYVAANGDTAFRIKTRKHTAHERFVLLQGSESTELEGLQRGKYWVHVSLSFSSSWLLFWGKLSVYITWKVFTITASPWPLVLKVAAFSVASLSCKYGISCKLAGRAQGPVFYKPIDYSHGCCNLRKSALCPYEFQRATHSILGMI